MTRRGRLRTVAVLLACAGGVGAPLAGQSDDDRIELAVAARGSSGSVLDALDPTELEVAIDGAPVDAERISLAAPSGPVRVVLYIDHAASRASSVQRLVSSLLDQSERLLDLPELEIVEADPVPQTMPRVASVEELERSLNRVFLRREDSDEVAQLRSSFLAEVRKGEEPHLVIAEAAYGLELDLRRDQLDGLLEWVAAQGPSREPKILMLLNDNLGLEAKDFYLRGLTASAEVVGQWAAEPDLTELASALAVYGWTLVPVRPELAKDGGRLSYQPSEELPVGFRVGLGRRPRAEAAPSQDLGWDFGAVARLEEAAGLTGGEVVTDLGALSDWVEAYSSRSVLRIADVSLPPGEMRTVRVASRSSGVNVLAPGRVGRGTPNSVAAMRARRAVAGDSGLAELQVRSAIEFDPDLLGRQPGRFEVRVDLFELRERLGQFDQGSFRVTVAVHLETEELLLRHEIVRDVDLRGQDEWRYEGSLRVPPETDGAVVLVEVLESGDWGESFASFITKTVPTLAATSEDLPAPRGLLPDRRIIRIEPPADAVLIGKVRVEAEADPAVQRVVFTLDGDRVATRRREPWATNVDLGPNPRQRLLGVVAYGARGKELGRDTLTLNEVTKSFGVRIVEPRSGRRVGPVDVEAEVNLPSPAKLDRLEFFWQDQLVSTMRRPPFRQRLFIPVASEPGLIRVAAYLEDGRIAEDVVLMNTDLFEELLTVKLVELYAVVTDRSGKPVRDLEREDFEILEQGAPQEIENFSRAGDLPITVGLALDSSLSLFVKMPAVQEAAGDFVRGLMEDRDRAFLVGFSSRPRVVRATTSDLDNVISGIESLTPTGTTALWEAVVLSLLQLQEATGRKALVLFYDGDDEDEDFSFSTSLKLAQKVGVPIYLIIMNNSAARSGGKSFGTKNRASRLEKIARAGGGKVFYVRTDQDLGEIFTAIREELRAHYLLTYYPKIVDEEAAEGAESDWRPIDLVVKRPGLVARTLAGYQKP